LPALQTSYFYASGKISLSENRKRDFPTSERIKVFWSRFEVYLSSLKVIVAVYVGYLLCYGYPVSNLCPLMTDCH